MDTWVTILGLIVTVLAAVAGIAAAVRAKWPHHDARRTATVDRFLATRRYLKEHVQELIELALAQQSGLLADATIPLLARPGWILSQPIPLRNVVLRRIEPRPRDRCDAALAKLRRYWPMSAPGERMHSYHEAITAYDKPTNWFNGASYRLLDVTVREQTLEMTFTATRYWDMFDTTEALQYEVAFVHSRSRGRKIRGPYRRFLRDAFDFTHRCAIPGIDALTIRQDQYGGTFYVHRRDARDVASALNITGIIPAGEFQPSDDSHFAYVADFDLWHAIVREYVEEFLGLQDARERTGAPIDFNQPPYSLLHDAYRSGKIEPHFLGIGLDPVTWKPTILTVCVFEPDLFDSLFTGMVRASGEGILELPTRAKTPRGIFTGQSFLEDIVLDYVRSPAVLPAARAGLALAWRFREELGVGCAK